MLHAIGIPVIMFSVGGAAALISQADGVLKSGMLLGLIAGILIGRYDLKCWLVLTFFLSPEFRCSLDPCQGGNRQCRNHLCGCLRGRLGCPVHRPRY
jgi:hypothetical protein